MRSEILSPDSWVEFNQDSNELKLLNKGSRLHKEIKEKLRLLYIIEITRQNILYTECNSKVSK